MNFKAVFILCLHWNSVHSGKRAEGNTDVQEVNVFYIRLYKVLNRAGNFVFSPISVETSMYLAYDGSQGTTSDAIQRVVWPSPSQTPIERYNNVTRTIRNSEVAIFLEPNKIYVSDLLNLSSSYIDTVKRKYLTDVTSINFSNREQVATAINKWVSNVTNTQIEDLINKTDFGHHHYTSILMFSCVDFTGVWDFKFKLEDTKLQAFYLNDRDSKQVEMMHMTNKLDILVDAKLDAKMLVLPFTDKNYVLTIFMPNQRDKIEDMKNKLFDLNVPVGEFVKNATARTVNLALPKFRLESILSLKDPLSNMGLGEMFSGSANFSRMLDKPNRFNEVFVNDIIQKSYFEVNEIGVEGAIGTVEKHCEKRVKRSASDAPIDFIINCPFVLFLSVGDTENGFVDVFSGQVYDP